MGVDVFDAIAVKSSIIVGAGSQTKPSLAFSNGESGFYESSTGIVSFSTANSYRFTFSSTGIAFQGGTARPAILNIDTTATVPNICPNYADQNTGIGSVSVDNLSLIAGGLEGARIEDPADCSATETSLWLYDKDNDTVEKVTVGAADSGGAGFKVLRIPN